MFDSSKEQRFRRPEFQRKLRVASRYERKTAPEGPSLLIRFLGLFSPFSRFGRFFWFAAVIVAIYFLAISPHFLIKKITVTTTGIEPERFASVIENLRRDRYFLIPRSHLLLLTPQVFFGALQQELPQVRKITSFKRGWPDRLEIAVEQREARYVWQSGTEYYLIDQEGVAFVKIFQYSQDAFTQELIVDKSGGKVALGQKLKIEKQLSFLNELKSGWAKEITAVNYTSFAIPTALSGDLSVRTSIGFEVYFDIERSASAQLKNLNLLLTQEIKPETYNGLSYIDVRLGNVAYYCYKDAPCAQSP